MSRIISIDINASNGAYSDRLYGIVFEYGVIKNFLFAPADYTVGEFVDIIMKPFGNNKIVFDKNGIGVLLDDYIIDNKEYVDYKDMVLIFEKAKDNLMDMAMNSNFNNKLFKTEFKKLVDEMENLEIKTDINSCLRLKIKDKEKNISRAICYLQYFVVQNR